MATTIPARRRVLLALAPLLSGCASDAASRTTLRVTLAAIHAAALVEPRAASDSVDRPFLLVSVVGPGARTAVVRAPQTGQLRIHRGEILRERPLTDVRLGPGDTVQILVSLLEGPTTPDPRSTAMAVATTAALHAPNAASGPALAAAIAPLVRSGARWLGSATLRLTDERGTVYWHGFECLETCAVLSGASDTPFQAPDAEPNVGTVELSGGGAKYHVKLSVRAL
jgi:hypothetical protein